MGFGGTISPFLRRIHRFLASIDFATTLTRSVSVPRLLLHQRQAMTTLALVLVPPSARRTKCSIVASSYASFARHQ